MTPVYPHIRRCWPAKFLVSRPIASRRCGARANARLRRAEWAVPPGNAAPRPPFSMITVG